MQIPMIDTTTLPSAQRKAVQWIQSGDKRLLVGGEWIPARSGKSFGTVNPATEEALCNVCEAGEADIDAAVAAARRAFEAKSWSGISPHARGRALMRIAEQMERHADELSTIETFDTGMPLWYSAGAAALATEVFRYYAGWPSKILGNTVPTDASGLMYTVREPLGVCGQIIPWNNPVMIASIKIANALACGNTLVLKPAELAPLSVLRLAELIQETDLPAGVINIVPGYGPTAGAALARHLGVDKIAFTGSTAVGKQIVMDSTGNLKKVMLELGGKAPNILFPDADIDKALQSAVKSFCGNSGQVCSAATRLFVHESMHDDVSERVTKIVAGFKVGSPLDADTKLGPLISSKQRDRVMTYIASRREAGAHLSLGGSCPDGRGYFVQPTVFSGVRNTMRIAQEEIFGPVLSIIPFRDEEDAVFQSNETAYGLSAAAWTRDISRAHQVARALKAGRVWINTFGDADPAMPTGGFKQSGWGRELGIESIDAYTQVKAVLLRM